MTTTAAQVRFFAGVATQDGLSWFAIAGLVLVTLGVLVYRASPELAVIPSVRAPSLTKQHDSPQRAHLLSVASGAPERDGHGLSRPRQSSAVELPETARPLLQSECEQ